MRLILVRHAKAAPGPTRRAPPLTVRGRKAAAALGQLLAGKGPEAVVSSPLLRARETAAAIASAAGLEPTVDVRLAPGATAESLKAAVAGLGETVVAVGHQPDCGLIVLALTGREIRFPPAGFSEVDL